MARPGPPPIPTEEKRRRGNPGKRPLPAVGALALVPAAEAKLYELDPVAALDAVLERGAVWLGDTDSMVLALLRQALEERTSVRDRAMGGSSEARAELRKLDAQVIAMLSQLGFDPTARARLGLTEVKARSKLEQLRDRHSSPVPDPDFDG